MIWYNHCHSFWYSSTCSAALRVLIGFVAPALFSMLSSEMVFIFPASPGAGTLTASVLSCGVDSIILFMMNSSLTLCFSDYLSPSPISAVLSFSNCSRTRSLLSSTCLLCLQFSTVL